MRLIVCGLSAVLLSGCSWLGGFGGSGHHGPQAKSSHYGYGGQYGAKAHKRGAHNPCQIYSPQQPVPRGCDPASVTLATPGSQYGGFPQEPNFGGGYGAQYGGGQYASQGYGSHAGVAHQQAAQYNPRKQLRKPRWRGSMSMGFEKSISGNLLDYTKAGVADPTTSYNPQDYNEGMVEGSQAGGSVTTTTYTANNRSNDQIAAPNSIFTPFGYDSINRPDISYDDVHSTPFRIAGGLEYIANPRTTLFANAGYSFAEGENGTVASVDATGYRLVSTQAWVEDTDAMGNGLGTYSPNGAPTENITFVPNGQIATFDYDFSEMKRIDLEVGGRHYFNPLVKDQGFKTVTPFVGASVGASHYNGVSYEVTQRQAHYSDFFDGSAEVGFYDVVGPAQNVTLYDSQWLASGQLNAGVEWQLTPKTALAFETGVRVEQGRKYANTGERGDTNVAIPVTIRGSYNF